MYVLHVTRHDTAVSSRHAPRCDVMSSKHNCLTRLFSKKHNSYRRCKCHHMQNHSYDLVVERTWISALQRSSSVDTLFHVVKYLTGILVVLIRHEQQIQFVPIKVFICWIHCHSWLLSSATWGSVREVGMSFVTFINLDLEELVAGLSSHFVLLWLCFIRQ